MPGLSEAKPGGGIANIDRRRPRIRFARSALRHYRRMLFRICGHRIKAALLDYRRSLRGGGNLDQPRLASGSLVPVTMPGGEDGPSYARSALSCHRESRLIVVPAQEHRNSPSPLAGEGAP